MKSRGKMFVLMLSVLMLMGAWVLAEYMAGPFSNRETAAALSDSALMNISVGTAQELCALSWSYDGQTVNLARSSETGRWINADDETCPLDGKKVSVLAKAAASIMVEGAVKSVTDFAPYGLDKPAITIIAATGEEVAGYDLGGTSITGQSYLRRSGENVVYLETGALARAFSIGIEDVLALENIPKDITAVTGFSVRTEAGSYDLLWEAGSGWTVTRGENQSAISADLARQLYEPVTELELNRCATWNVEKPEEYGLTSLQGEATVAYTAAGGSTGEFTLEFGSYVEDGVYVRFAGSDMVYTVPGSVLDGLMYPAWNTMLPVTVLPFDIQTVSRLIISLGGHEYDIDRLRDVTEVSVGGEPMELTDIIYSCNGWILDTDAMDGWLTAVAGLTAESTLSQAQGREKLFSVKIGWNDETGDPVTLEIRTYDSTHHLCIVNEMDWFLVSKAEAEALIAQIENILTPE